MAHEPTSTTRSRRLRERRAKGVAMVAPVEVGAGGIELLVGNGLLQEHEVRDREAVGAACLAALEEWAGGHGARTTDHGTGLRPPDRAWLKPTNVQPQWHPNDRGWIPVQAPGLVARD